MSKIYLRNFVDTPNQINKYFNRIFYCIYLFVNKFDSYYRYNLNGRNIPPASKAGFALVRWWRLGPDLRWPSLFRSYPGQSIPPSEKKIMYPKIIIFSLALELYTIKSTFIDFVSSNNLKTIFSLNLELYRINLLIK